MALAGNSYLAEGTMALAGRERRHGSGYALEDASLPGQISHLYFPGRSAAEDAVSDRSPAEAELILARRPCLTFSAAVKWWEEVAAARKDSIRTSPICSPMLS
ncbi:hypothetical protein E2562_030559 [Oryza meyeriana var. granulata]|uniref:Uncharacterized protein n=1 Tax=Oryza meyeriana var. granulata TaxID=110450 RepID=A0A6G1D9F7_9ORYZ|nr:hypothetical protein E2562_030559 [Oryza meyeriana var. granulata]